MEEQKTALPRAQKQVFTVAIIEPGVEMALIILLILVLGRAADGITILVVLIPAVIGGACITQITRNDQQRSGE